MEATAKVTGSDRKQPGGGGQDLGLSDGGDGSVISSSWDQQGPVVWGGHCNGHLPRGHLLFPCDVKRVLGMVRRMSLGRS